MNWKKIANTSHNNNNNNEQNFLLINSGQNIQLILQSNQLTLDNLVKIYFDIPAVKNHESKIFFFFFK